MPEQVGCERNGQGQRLQALHRIPGWHSDPIEPRTVGNVCAERRHRDTRTFHQHIDGLVQERRNSSALAMELRLFCTNTST